MQSQLTQVAFDEAVTFYVENFGSDAITARKEAIDEFVLQGFDLSFVDLTQGEEIVREHESIPLERALDAFSSSLDILKEIRTSSSCETDQGQTNQICSSLEQFSSICSSNGFGSSGLNLVSMVGEKEVTTLLGVCNSLLPSVYIEKILACLTVLMVTHENRCLAARFLHAPGSLDNFFMCCSKAEFAVGLNHFFSQAIVGQTILKEKLLSKYSTVSEGIDSTDPEVVHSTCKLLIALMTDDDETTLVSIKNRHALVLHEKGLLRKLGAAIRMWVQNEQVQPLVTLLELLSYLLLCESICRSVEIETADILMEIIRGRQSGVVLTKSCKCVRQLLMSDIWKLKLLDMNIIVSFVALLKRGHTEIQLLENVVAGFACLTLRNLDAVSTIHAHGGIDEILKIMRSCDYAKVLRQCCILVRNMAVRNVDVKNYLMSTDVEHILQKLKVHYPKYCLDVGSSALRDLGCADYNLGWTPKTPVLGSDGVIFDFRQS